MVIAGCGGTDAAAPPDAQEPSPVPGSATTPTATPPTPTSSTTPAPRTAPPELPGLSRRDQRLVADYLSWTRLTLPASAAALGSGAHPGTKRVFVSRPVRATPYPPNTVVLKDARVGDVTTLIAIMEKVPGASADLGGWRYVEYKRADAASDFAPVSFPESGCASCHAGANATRADADWVFSQPK